MVRNILGIVSEHYKLLLEDIEAGNWEELCQGNDANIHEQKNCALLSLGSLVRRLSKIHCLPIPDAEVVLLSVHTGCQGSVHYRGLRYSLDCRGLSFPMLS